MDGYRKLVRNIGQQRARLADSTVTNDGCFHAVHAPSPSFAYARQRSIQVFVRNRVLERETFGLKFQPMAGDKQLLPYDRRRRVHRHDAGAHRRTANDRHSTSWDQRSRQRLHTRGHTTNVERGKNGCTLYHHTLQATKHAAI
jgi:hypothetical protein